MSIYEYNQEEHLRMEREDAFEDGRKIGLEDGRKIGLEAGRKEGQEAERTKIFDLIHKMTADGMADLIPKLSDEPAFYEEMLKKYNL